MSASKRAALLFACLSLRLGWTVGFVNLSSQRSVLREGIKTRIGRRLGVLADDDILASSPRVEEEESSGGVEYAAVQAGQVMHIQVGDPSQSRKVWKKRRRSDSPVLVPCSILNCSLDWMLRWNIMYILHKYGDKLATASGGVQLTMKKMCRLYQRDLNGSLMQHAKSQGYDKVGDYLLHLFNDDQRFKAEYGVQIVTGLKENLILQSSTPYKLARQMAAQAGLIQFRPDPHNNSQMIHTGQVKVRAPRTNASQKHSPPSFHVQNLSAAIRISQSDIYSKRVHSALQTNAFVLSYSPQGDNSNPLLVLTIDPTRSHVRTSMKRRARAKRVQEYTNKENYINQQIKNKKIEWDLHKDLKVGDGPLKAKVAKVSVKSRAAFVDCAVGKKQSNSNKNNGNMVKVLGMLRFDDLLKKAMGEEVEMDMQMDNTAADVMSQEEQDIIEAALGNWDDYDEDDDDDDDDVLTIDDLFMDHDEHEEGEEIMEDVTNQFAVGQDGTLSSIDPKTGEKTLLATSDEEYDGEDDDEEEDAFSGMTPQERLNAIGRMLDNEREAIQREESEEKQQLLEEQQHQQYSSLSKSSTAAHVQTNHAQDDTPLFLSIGDEIDVYIKAIYPQSGRFMVTVDSSIQGRKAKEMKQEREVEKRMLKLAGEDGEGLGKILNCVGLECDAVVRAKSKSDEDSRWYVQPVLSKAEGGPLPVGVATLKDDLVLEGGLESGDEIKIKIEGIDEGRGQLALTILGRK